MFTQLKIWNLQFYHESLWQIYVLGKNLQLVLKSAAVSWSGATVLIVTITGLQVFSQSEFINLLLTLVSTLKH